jgi:arylsulfatase A-like enzyme
MRAALATVAVMLASGLPGSMAEGVDTRPNIVVLLADDLGFSDLGCYGGEIQTPQLDALAAQGVRFTRFYNTGRCWPTRASILTGYYAQQVRMDPPRGRFAAWTRVMPEYLKPLGYRCYHVGKWHVHGAPRPVADGGFDRSYWFEDWDRYFSPALHYLDDQLLPPVDRESGYYATTAFADHAIRFLQEHGASHAGEPFFLYLAFVAPHFPLHALAPDVRRYEDRYLEGWDVLRQERAARVRELGLVDSPPAARDAQLSPRYLAPDLLDKVGAGEVTHAGAWDELTPAQQRFQATKMALHAAMVDRLDQEIGRVVEHLRNDGQWDNTLIIFLSDNGADATLIVRGDGHDPQAAPGSAASFLCLGPGWASAANAPLRRQKVWVSEGGVATPLIAHWPAGQLVEGALRHDVGHVIDLLPTLVEAAGGSFPEDRSGAPPLAGRSLLPALRGGSVPPPEMLFFHHEGNRALHIGDWKLVSAREDGDVWQLFDLAQDRGETRDRAAEEPQRAASMAAQWTQLEEEISTPGTAGVKSIQGHGAETMVIGSHWTQFGIGGTGPPIGSLTIPLRSSCMHFQLACIAAAPKSLSPGW